MKPKLYFGHPINAYGISLETELLRKIAKNFPEWEIENPNQKHHSEGYERWKQTTGNGMDYYFKTVLPSCHAGIFLPFRDGKWGAGVFGEAKFLACLGRPIWQITAEGIIYIIDNIALIQVLSVEETRSRVRTTSGEIAPY